MEKETSPISSQEKVLKITRNALFGLAIISLLFSGTAAVVLGAGGLAAHAMSKKKS